MTERSTHIVEVGLDYLSMSLPLGTRDYPQWLNKCVKVMTTIADLGNELKYGTYQGYEGWHCGGAFYGDRTDGGHIHLPGRYADEYFNALYHAEAHYSRLDLQVTLRFEPFDLKHIEEEEERANRDNSLLPENRKRVIRAIRDNGGGRTLYIGVRTSPVFCRIYNKEAKSSDEVYTHTWRYEIELHNDMACRVASRLSANSNAIYPMCASLVWQTYYDRGITPPYTKEQEAQALPSSQVQASDVDRRLNWLRTQVAPCIQKLLTVVPSDMILEALGLAETLPVEP